MKYLILTLFIIAYITQAEYNKSDSLKETAQFEKDQKRLGELMEQIDGIIQYLDSDDAKNLTQDQYKELLKEVQSMEYEIKQISAAYKKPEDQDL